MACLHKRKCVKIGENSENNKNVKRTRGKIKNFEVQEISKLVKKKPNKM